MDQHSTVQWVPITINLFVHIFMYYVSRLQCPTLPLLNSQAADPVELLLQAFKPDCSARAPSRAQYYAMASIKIQPWWKRYLTQLQIVQFVVDIAACVYASSHEPVVSGLGLGALLSGRASCNGTLEGAVVGVGIIFSYLVLFLVFYANTVRGRSTNGVRVASFCVLLLVRLHFSPCLNVF